jgi:hypothetical protein
MIAQHTQVNLALYIGETYCEIEARDESHQVFYKKNIFLPQTSIKSLLINCKKELTDLNKSVKSIFIVTRYLEKLKTFRLGGSVIQIIHEGLENNYTLQDSTQISLAASSLIIALKKSVKKEEINSLLDSQFEKITKINPDADKVVFHLNPQLISQDIYTEINNYFLEKKFRIFKNDSSDELLKIRKVLLNAGTEGTKEEILKEFQDAFPDSSIYFWVNDSFCQKFENCDLFFSFSDFIGAQRLNAQANVSQKILHLDIENWMVLENKKQKIWNSPWGQIERSHYVSQKLSVHPLTEIYIDQNALLQFSKSPVPSEPGPMVAGRSVKSVILDLFFENVVNNSQLNELFPQIKIPLNQSKILSQFKVIEHSQKSEHMNYNLEDLKSFIMELIEFDLGRLGYKIAPQSIFGHLGSILNKKQPAGKSTECSWTECIFKAVQKNLVTEGKA